MKKSRETAGLTQEELAFQANVDRSYISQLENDKKSPTLEMLVRLCDVLEVKPSVLISQIEASRSKD